MMELSRFVGDFTLLDHPVDHKDGTNGMIGMVSRGVSSQWLFQRSPLNTLGRTVALFEQTPYPEDAPCRVLTKGWQERLLGASITEYCSAAFLMHSLAVQGLPYPFGLPTQDLPLFADKDDEESFHRIAHRSFLATIEEFQRPIPRLAEAAEQWQVPEFDLEPWGFNALQDRPFVGGMSDGHWIAPCAPIVLQKASSPSIAYAGLAKFKNDFTYELGYLFQAYIGRHLRLIRGAVVHPEIHFRPSNQSVDWVLVTPTATFLIECKSAFPSADVREGRATLVEAHQKVIGRGIDQINRTAARIREARPEFADIPADRPLIGLVITLGDYDLANNELLRSQLTAAQVPTAGISSEFLERAVGHPAPVWDHVAKIATSSVSASNVFEPRHLLDAYPATRRNAIIDAAYELLPIVQSLGSRGLPS
ncbi:hypothetical protein ACF1AJ_20125 [Leifsonia sp. NPDC014704]|uniref:hypothetical protein n=1 Tax=Leifsonia sp. NPDC014704 TaxID=3364123 RepID=UPI000EB14147